MLNGILDFLKPTTPSPAKDQPPIPLRLDTPIPTRSEMLEVLKGLIQGSIPNALGTPYVLIKEDKGRSNRSVDIDKLITNQGGRLGDPYCQLGMQEVLDELCRYYGVNRKYVQVPEGASTQTVYNMTFVKYKFTTDPKPMCWVTWHVPGKWSGHVGMILECYKNGSFKTFEFNTTVRTDGEVVRDGEGATYAVRKQSGMGSLKIKGYIDIYQAIVDAMETQKAQ